MYKRAQILDVIILSVFAVLITFQPFFLHQQLNVFELGIYLPAIGGILDGLVPFRDFFYLRGPLEIFIPASLMKVFGREVSVLMAFFYIGTVLTFVISVFLAWKVFRSRLIFYLIIPVLIARTFTRVVFTFWGGIRFGFGLLALFFLVQYLRTKKSIYLFWCGIVVSCGFWTSAEVGVWSCFAVAGTLGVLFLQKYQKNNELLKGAGFFAAGGALGSFPFIAYLVMNQAFLPMLDSVWSVVSNMLNVFPQLDPSPRNFKDVVAIMTDPNSVNFKHLTVIYCYVAFFAYFVWRWRSKSLDEFDYCFFAIFLYAVGTYYSAFRNIWSAQFEMALQPEKFLLFFLMERALFALKEKRKWLRWGFITVIVMSSVCYSLARYHNRFPAFRALETLSWQSAKPVDEEPFERLNLMRLKGVEVPSWQAEDFRLLQKFVIQRGAPDEKILMFPEMAFYHFIIDRPWVSRFPMVTFSWMNDRWHEEFMKELRSDPPRFAVMPKVLPVHYERQYFSVKKNRQNYDDVMTFVNENYKLVQTTPSIMIFQKMESQFAQSDPVFKRDVLWD